jgi:HAMP domain-containing protein
MKPTLKSLAFKISVFVVSVMLISLVAFSLVFISSERNKLAADIIKSGESFANFSTREIYENYIQYYAHPRPEDFQTFKENVQVILANNPDIVRVSLLGVNGRVLFDSEEFQTGKYEGAFRQISDKATLDIIISEQTSHREVENNDQTVTEIIVPIYQSSGHLFSMRYFLSQESLTGRMNEVYRQIFFVVFPGLVLVTFLTLLFTITLTRPLKTLTRAAEKIREGNFDIKTEIKSQDEIGRLAAVFNEMAAKLKESYSILEAKVRERTIELEKERGSLEKRIKDRTAELEKLKIGLEQTVEERTKALEAKLVEMDRMNKHMIGRELKMAELKEELDKLKGNKK